MLFLLLCISIKHSLFFGPTSWDVNGLYSYFVLYSVYVIVHHLRKRFPTVTQNLISETHKQTKRHILNAEVFKPGVNKKKKY